MRWQCIARRLRFAVRFTYVLFVFQSILLTQIDKTSFCKITHDAQVFRWEDCFWSDLEATILTLTNCLYLTRCRISGMAAAIENVGAALLKWRRPIWTPPFYRNTRSHEIEKVSVYQNGDLLLSKRKQSILSLEYFCIIKAIHNDVYSICFNYFAIETQIKDQ